MPMNPKIYGKDLSTTSIPHSFVLEGGGMGDYINWCSAIKYIAENYTHVDGRVFCSGLFLDVAKYLFEKYPGWKVAHRDDINKVHENGAGMCAPKRGTQLLNACGSHLLDLGFHYYICINPPPKEYNKLVEIDFEGAWKWPELNPKSNYCVFTPGSTTEAREMPVHGFNELVLYAISKGLTPVFLGKADLSENYQAKFLNYNLSQGVDLRERTTILEAVQIMRGAKFVIGLDNGLLHMAGTTNVPVIFGHNITSIEHREIRRDKGLTINITASEETLPCIGCQSKVRFVSKHDFRFCLFRDNQDLNKRCIFHLFKNNSKPWKDAIDKCLEDGDKYRESEKSIAVRI